MKRINQRAGSLEEYARGYRYYGFNRDAETGAWTYREWAPAARRVSLIGDFNGWNRESHPLERNERGVWEITLPPDALAHGQKVKVHVVGADGTGRDHVPAGGDGCGDRLPGRGGRDADRAGSDGFLQSDCGQIGGRL